MHKPDDIYGYDIIRSFDKYMRDSFTHNGWYGEALHPIIKRFGTWAVTRYGLENLCWYYPVPFCDLYAKHGGTCGERIIEHVSNKTWMNESTTKDLRDAVEFALNMKLQRDRHKPRSTKLDSLPSAARFKVLERDGFACRYCGRNGPDVILHVDHVIPRSKGGTHKMENLVTACKECNHGKRDRIIATEEA